VNTHGDSRCKNHNAWKMDKKIQSSAGQSLGIRQAHWVQCDNSMCLAVLDKSGKWKSFSNDRELTDFVKVCAG
jgi:hypothetical protein